MVEPNEEEDLETTKSGHSVCPHDYEDYNSAIDSAEYYLKKDAKTSIQFIANALSNGKSIEDNTNAYRVLGDIYSYWKQYDLAVPNYRISLQNQNSISVKFKLAEAYKNIQNFQESLKAYSSLYKNSLPNYQLVGFYE